MRLLLDTHAFAWAIANDAKLPDRVAGLITDPASAVWVSAVAIYELEYKRPFDDEIQFLPTDLIAAARTQGYEWLPVSPAHAQAAARLDRMHRDPWDRMIVGQAIVESMTVVTKDRAFNALGATVVWI